MRILPEDPKQRHLLHRFMLALGAAAMVMAMLCAMTYAALIEQSIFLRTIAVSGLLATTFFAVLRSGLNLRFPDPSLTLPMIVASTLVMLYVIDNSPEARHLLVLVYLVPFMFGVLRLSIAEMCAVAALFIGGYAWSLYRDFALIKSTEATYQIGLQLGITASLLLWFGLFAGYVGRLRKLAADTHRKLETALAQLQKLVSYDDLTGLHTRRHIMEMLAREKGRSDRSRSRFCLLMIDLDHFKSINDSYGHAVGDATLQKFAQYALSILRPSDMLARFGGEEFLLLSLDTDLAGANTLAERIRSTIETMTVPGLPGDRGATVSIGIAEYVPGESVAEVLQRADAALYAAKHGGRNNVQSQAHTGKATARTPEG